jgi:hypothetical protein
VSHVVSLVRHFLTLAFACVLLGAGTSSGGEIQTEPSWPTVPQVAAEEPSPVSSWSSKSAPGHPVIRSSSATCAPGPPPMAHASYST